MRLFTVTEANALIPRLEAIFEELRQLRSELRPAQAELAALEQKKRSNGADHSAEVRRLRERLDTGVNRLNNLLQEIASLGGEVKDVELGLVDFPHERDGRVVYLCWKVGEDRIRYWHELASGFAGRQPLASDEDEG